MALYQAMIQLALDLARLSNPDYDWQTDEQALNDFFIKINAKNPYDVEIEAFLDQCNQERLLLVLSKLTPTQTTIIKMVEKKLTAGEEKLASAVTEFITNQIEADKFKHFLNQHNKRELLKIAAQIHAAHPKFYLFKMDSIPSKFEGLQSQLIGRNAVILCNNELYFADQKKKKVNPIEVNDDNKDSIKELKLKCEQIDKYKRPNEDELLLILSVTKQITLEQLEKLSLLSNIVENKIAGVNDSSANAKHKLSNVEKALANLWGLVILGIPYINPDKNIAMTLLKLWWDHSELETIVSALLTGFDENFTIDEQIYYLAIAIKKALPAAIEHDYKLHKVPIDRVNKMEPTLKAVLGEVSTILDTKLALYRKINTQINELKEAYTTYEINRPKEIKQQELSLDSLQHEQPEKQLEIYDAEINKKLELIDKIHKSSKSFREVNKTKHDAAILFAAENAQELKEASISAGHSSNNSTKIPISFDVDGKLLKPYKDTLQSCNDFETETVKRIKDEIKEIEQARQTLLKDQISLSLKLPQLRLKNTKINAKNSKDLVKMAEESYVRSLEEHLGETMLDEIKGEHCIPKSGVTLAQSCNNKKREWLTYEYDSLLDQLDHLQAHLAILLIKLGHELVNLQSDQIAVEASIRKIKGQIGSADFVDRLKETEQLIHHVNGLLTEKINFAAIDTLFSTIQNTKQSLDSSNKTLEQYYIEIAPSKADKLSTLLAEQSDMLTKRDTTLARFEQQLYDYNKYVVELEIEKAKHVSQLNLNALKAAISEDQQLLDKVAKTDMTSKDRIALLADIEKRLAPPIELTNEHSDEKDTLEKLGIQLRKATDSLKQEITLLKAKEELLINQQKALSTVATKFFNLEENSTGIFVNYLSARAKQFNLRDRMSKFFAKLLKAIGITYVPEVVKRETYIRTLKNDIHALSVNGNDSIPDENKLTTSLAKLQIDLQDGLKNFTPRVKKGKTDYNKTLRANLELLQEELKEKCPTPTVNPTSKKEKHSMVFFKTVENAAQHLTGCGPRLGTGPLR